VKVEIFSDVACPFCYIGKRHFESALAAFAHADEVEVTWRSFQLDPTAPRERTGVGTYDRLAAKYRITREEAEAMGARVAAMGKSAGLDLLFDRVLTVNTLDAHRMIHLARQQGSGKGPPDVEDRMVEALFAAHFTNGENLADPEVLVRLAGEAGIPPDLARSALADGSFEAGVKAEFEEASEIGLSGVPAFILDRSLLVSGAQPREVLLGALEQARQSESSAA
jgi:predicted DsbA family dithiol-disulfide isomerase